ncbi:hypothetical protein CTAYLR_000630 [Chrysophaeum taylorii]|uniref:HSF-type DNA-binding domain-containing protein n=1 Tax=Chrysophaeum taylorii TaxID=2483200 RepID=A0AAD7U8S1_9STRA|nr:hypothetical protein CTAYLR_000630 [Chrysophaeum taylorii]
MYRDRRRAEVAVALPACQTLSQQCSVAKEERPLRLHPLDGAPIPTAPRQRLERRTCTQCTVPVPFLERLVRMFTDWPELIQWREGAVVVYDTRTLEHKLPLYFRHGNYRSFLRQLNNFGFTKVDDWDSTIIVYARAEGRKVTTIKGLLMLRPRERKREKSMSRPRALDFARLPDHRLSAPLLQQKEAPQIYDHQPWMAARQRHDETTYAANALDRNHIVQQQRLLRQPSKIFRVRQAPCFHQHHQQVVARTQIVHADFFHQHHLADRQLVVPPPNRRSPVIENFSFHHLAQSPQHHELFVSPSSNAPPVCSPPSKRRLILQSERSDAEALLSLRGKVSEKLQVLARDDDTPAIRHQIHPPNHFTASPITTTQPNGASWLTPATFL